MRGTLRLRLQRERDQPFDLVVSDLAWSPGAWRVRQAIQSMGRKAGPPRGHAGAADLELARHARIGRTRLGAGQHDAGALDEGLAGVAPAHNPLQLGPFMLAQVKRNRLGPACHGSLPTMTREASAHIS